MDDRTPAYLPEDPPNTLYGFSFSDWQAASARSNSQFDFPIHLWDTLIAVGRAGGNPGFSSEAFLALAQLGPEHARRVVARIGLPNPDSLPAVDHVVSELVAEASTDGTPVSKEVAESWRQDVEEQLERIRTIFRLANT